MDEAFTSGGTAIGSGNAETTRRRRIDRAGIRLKLVAFAALSKVVEME